MWHLKTRLGVFWVAPIYEAPNQYYLGIGNQELGKYRDAEAAARDVHNHVTGFIKWDLDANGRAPEHISDWVEGEPKDWEK